MHGWERRLLRLLARLPKVRGLGVIYARLQTLRRLKADIFHVQYAAGADAWLAGVAGLRPLAVSVWAADVLFDDYPRPANAERLTRDLLASADLVTAESERMLGVARRLRPDGRFALVHWGIDTGRFQPRPASALRARFGIPAAAPLLYSPRIPQPLYNIDVIVRALPQIKAGHPDVRLLIGTYFEDPAYRLKLEALGTELGVRDSMIFLPLLEVDEVAAVYNTSDVAIAIPATDGMPRSMMEAMACGVPLILSRLPVYEEFVTDRHEALLTPIDPHAVAAAVVELLDNPALGARLRQQALAVAAQRFSDDAEAARMAALYEELRHRIGAKRPASFRAAMLLRLLVTFACKR